MSTLLEMPTNRVFSAPAERLRTTMAAVRVSLSWFGTRKTLTAEQKAEAAEPFGTDARFLSAGKRLLDISHPAYKAVTAVRNKVIAVLEVDVAAVSRAGHPADPPGPDRRLRRQDAGVPGGTGRSRRHSRPSLQRTEGHRPAAARIAVQRRGLPRVAAGHVSMSSDFPSVEPPDYLQQLNPQLYEQECQRVQSRFDEAVRLAEEAFTAELAKLVSHLTERLSGQEDGKPKIFRDSAVENLTEFFGRFRELNVRSNEQLDQLVARPSGSSGASSRKTCATTPGCGSTSPRKCAGCRACWMACWWTGRGGTSSAARSDGDRHAAHHHTRRGCPVHLLRKRSTLPHWAAPPSPAHRTSSPTSRDAGGPICPRSAVQSGAV